MSEMQQQKVDDSMQSTNVTPDTSGPVSAGAKRSILIPIVAIIVVIALIGTAFAVMFLGLGTASKPYLDTKILPDTLNIPKGDTVRVNFYATLKNNTEDAGKNVSTSVQLSVTKKWVGTQICSISNGRDDNNLFWYDLTGTTIGTSKMNWTISYNDQAEGVIYKVYTEMTITVSNPILKIIEISPIDWFYLKGESKNYTAEAYMTDGTDVTNLTTYSWALSNASLGALSVATGKKITFTAGMNDVVGQLECTGSYLGVDVTQSASLKVGDIPPQEVTTRFYDMFGSPFTEGFWKDRYAENMLHQNSYPYTMVWLGNPAGNNWIESNIKMDVDAKNVSAINTLDTPWFVPILNPNPEIRGGNIHINWTMDYIVEDEARAYPPMIAMYYDSWFWRWNGTITMDRIAARMVTGMSDSDFDNFNAWKTSGFGAFKSAWSNWLLYEGNQRWGIEYAYEYPLNPMSETYDVEKVGDTIVFKIVDHVSWGMESLVQRWTRETFLPLEAWPEDIHLEMDITPRWANVSMTCAQWYFINAMSGIRDGQPTWSFEIIHADAVGGGSPTYSSEINPYLTKKYYNRWVSNAWYHQWATYDYMPFAWNLGANDKMIIEWPDAVNCIGYTHNGTGDWDNIVTGKVSPRWIEPVPTEAPSNVQIDYANHQIVLSGPFDIYDWSQNTVAAKEMKENWSKVGLLPRGLPYIEFTVNQDVGELPIPTAIAKDEFGVSKTQFAVGQTVTLDGSYSYDVDGSIVSYEWFVNDTAGTGWTSIGTGSTLNHAFGAECNFTVKLKVTDDTSPTALNNTDTILLNVFSNVPPTAKINVTATTAPVGTVLEFNGSGSFDPEGTTISYLWDFGDGTTSTSAVVNKAYSAPGWYTVKLTVTDAHPTIPRSGTDTKTMGILWKTGTPVAKIALQRIAVTGENILLDGSQSFVFNGTAITNYTWELGDGTMRYGVAVSDSWATSGTYLVNLTVRDAWNTSSPAQARITVMSAATSALSVSLGRHALMPDEQTTLTVKAVMPNGDVDTAFTGDVAISVSPAGHDNVAGTITFAAGDNGVKTVNVAFDLNGTYNISAEVVATPAINGYELATVNNRTVEITIYDIFQPILDDYWIPRATWYNYGDEGWRWDAPSASIFRPGNLQEGQVTTMYLLHVEARNVPEINVSNPTFMPVMNPTGNGGEIWYNYSYVNIDSALLAWLDGLGRLNQPATNWDGWETYGVGNITMDRVAAEQIINLPQAEANPENWWITDQGLGYDSNTTIILEWDYMWMTHEGGGIDYNLVDNLGRLDISAADDWYDWASGYWNSEYALHELPDGRISMTFWNVGYSYEAMYARWLYWGGELFGNNYPNGTPEGILPFEMWYDNLAISAHIGEESTNITIDAEVAYGFRSWKSDYAPDGTPSWRWEAIRMDYWYNSLPAVPYSELQIYSGLQYDVWDAGSAAFGKTIPYDYAPAIINLDEGEAVVFERPTEMSIGYLPVKMLGNYSMLTRPYLGGYYEWLKLIERFGNVSLHAFGCPAGTMVIDAGSGDLSIVGPLEPQIIYHADRGWVAYQTSPRIELWLDQ